MSDRHNSTWSQGLRMAMPLVLLLASLSANAGLFGFGGTSWQEEVLLHDGSKIVVTRSVDRGGRHEIGQQPPYKEQSLSFTMPGTNQNIVWKDSFSEDVGSANFLPMLLDIANDTAYLVVSPMGCLSYNKWGRPNPPYVVFKYHGNEWQRMPLQELPAEIKTPNLIFSDPDNVAKRIGTDPIPAETVQKIVSRYTQPHYKTILREAMKNAGGGCIKTDYYEKAGWLSPDWFTDQPSLEACLKFCDRKNIAAQTCPCKTLRGGEKP